MDAWIKILVVMVMFSALSMVMPFLLIDPFVGLILLGVLLTLLVLTLEPATGKAMAQVTVPLVLILFVFNYLEWSITYRHPVVRITFEFFFVVSFVDMFW